MNIKSRRHFIKSTLEVGAGAALHCALSAIAKVPFSSDEETAIRESAKYTMIFASPYSSNEWEVSPHTHSYLKKNVQELSEGQIYVDIRDKGSKGIGTDLMASVSRGFVSAALVSVSNLSPVAPELDILNIPFWAASSQEYVNLVTSDVWKTLIVDQIREQGLIDVLFHYIPGPRTATSTKNFERIIKTPSDIKDVNFRIPASKVLKIFYDLAGANPMQVDWKNVSTMSQVGRIDAMDPSIIGLYNGPNNLRQHIGVISQIDSVHDGWVAVINQQWYKRLSPYLQSALMAAAEKTFQDHLKRIIQVTQFCKQGFEKLETQIYTPSNDEKAEWVNQCGHFRPEWKAVKKKILGDPKHFSKLLEATKTDNGYVVNNDS